MQICGFRRNALKNALTWFFIALTAGVLRLVYHWFPHWLLFSTSSRCPFDQAQTMLVTVSMPSRRAPCDRAETFAFSRKRTRTNTRRTTSSR